MTSFFSFTFFALTVCNIHFCIWNQSTFIFMWSPFCPFWSVKYLSFWEKLTIQTVHHSFLESKEPEVTKNPYYVLSPQGSHKKVSAHELHVLYLKIHINNKRGYVVRLYRSTSQTSDEFDSFIANLEKSLVDTSGSNPHFIFIIGDFNAKSSNGVTNGK